MLLLRDGFYYKYKGDRTVRSLEDFALSGGYKEAEVQGAIPLKVLSPEAGQLKREER